ncbi:hypothetical protein Cni_G00453 [Canna indica]|uniref:Bifunctional inhibitor/plant lipid transfer protein/seed storage helical domain-containing protein n=1 Tax=Canna indica TaxID=4628 RepID=A0AAQ3Q0E9_9LILI|nr:hypothetical protein Cni_G00453 [Canna indica]
MDALLFLITTICAATSSYRSDCTNALIELAPCLDYVTDAVNCPSPDCCKQFIHVIETQPLCICAVFDGTASKLLGIPIDNGRAFSLPLACQGVTPELASMEKETSPNQLMERNGSGVHPSVIASAPFTGIP